MRSVLHHHHPTEGGLHEPRGTPYNPPMPRILEPDFIARHRAQRLATVDAQAEPALRTAGVDAADLDGNGAIEGDPELRRLYQKLLSLDASGSAQAGVDLDNPAVQPVYRALNARFAQRTGAEALLGNKRLVDVAELSAVRDGVFVLSRKDGVRQLGVGSVQEALVQVAAAEETRTGRPSLLRVSLGANNANRGLFGPGTEAAVRQLQLQVGLPSNGALDKDTLLALDVELSRARGAPAPGPTPAPAPASITHARFAPLPVFAEVLAGRALLKAGDRGPAVQALQQVLMDMGFPMLALQNDVGVSGVDGAFGGQTTTALKNFQVHAKKRFPAVGVSGVLDAATMSALLALAPAPGKKAWDPGQPVQAPTPCWNGDPSKKLRVVVVKDEHRTFLYDAAGACTGIFPNAHGSAGNATSTGLKVVRTRLDEAGARSTSMQLWGDTRSFGKRIVDLSWAAGGASGEELHGTFDYRGMGKDVSHGCVRHYNEDIITIFDAVAVGDRVAIVASVDEPMLRA